MGDQSQITMPLSAMQCHPHTASRHYIDFKVEIFNCRNRNVEVASAYRKKKYELNFSINLITYMYKGLFYDVMRPRQVQIFKLHLAMKF